MGAQRRLGVQGQGAVGVDRFELARTEVGDRLVADGVSRLVKRRRRLEVARGGGDAGVDDEGVAVCLGRLVVLI